MLSNVLSQKLNRRSIRLIACLAIIACLGWQAGLSEPVYAGSGRTPVQLEISTKTRILWTQQAAEYRVRLDQPEKLSIRKVTIQYKIVDQQTRCNAAALWSNNLTRYRRNVLLDKWRTKPNYLFLTRNSALKYLGKKFCFKVSKAPVGNQVYLDGYAGVEIEKWWTGVSPGGVCASVYVWIDDQAIMRGGQTTLRWKIANVRSPVSVQITGRNHNYWFYDTSQAEPNIKKQYGNPHEVTSTYDAASDTIIASRTVVGHLAPRVENLYTIRVHQAGCPTAQDAVFMRVADSKD